MDVFERFERILVLGTEELTEAALPSETTAGERAAKLGDVLYRLCIEHGVEWNGFREACIAAFAGPAPILIGRQGRAPEPFAIAIAGHHPLILLALEMMPADPDFDSEES